jgi:large subunit ribosomal protein L4e
MPKTAQIFSIEGKPTGNTSLPSIFETPLRPDVIKRAVIAIQSHRLQPQGRDLMAGKHTTAESRGTGMGIARVPREKGGGGKAKFAPGSVGGRQAHPPKVATRIVKNISKKEKQLALFSAIAATSDKETVQKRGHHIEDVLQIPLIVEDSFEALNRTKDVEQALTSLGVLPDITRVRDSRKVRAGKGKLRGRKMKQAIGPLIVVVENKSLSNAASNIPGVDITTVTKLNPELLAPGTHPGRLTVWTNGAIIQLEKMYGEGEKS